MLGTALDLVFPPSCAVCGREGSFLHDSCEVGLPRLSMPYCSLCADPGEAPLCRACEAHPPAYDGITAPYLMQGPVREVVFALKYRQVRASAPILGGLIAAHLGAHPVEADVMVPVRLHRRRQRERGYDQAALLARAAGAHSGMAVSDGVLWRTRDTPPQVSMAGPEQRRNNMEGAFECTGNVQGLRVLLIDDVVTTGSTMSACASALKGAGAASVLGVALARQGLPRA